MAENSAQERTEDATPKRLEDAKKKGQIPRSKELNTVISLLAGGVGMLIFGRPIVETIKEMLINSLSFGKVAAFSPTIIESNLLMNLKLISATLAPLFALLFVSTLISPVSLGGWVFSGDQFTPKMERISLMKGFGRMFSSKSLIELVKALAKFFLVGGTIVFVISLVLDQIFFLPQLSMTQLMDTTGALFIWCFLGFSSVLIVVALIDVPYQLWSFAKQLKMTKQEIRDEMKETEGKPEVKSAIRQRQQEIAQQRMMEDVPTADVVITNPTHFAVALRYDQSGNSAPKVVAKGRDFVAARIRELAKENNVPLFAAPPLARALFSTTDINQEIPANLFMAVAQVLAYIFQLKRATYSTKATIKRPKKLPIPDEYTDMEIL